MTNLRILTAGESHGKGLIGILEGMPAGLKIDKEKINFQLSRRQKGYGRGARMQIESDRIEILSGMRFGVTLGTPISIFIQNKDWANWEERMGIWKGKEDSPVSIPRPGHADLAGSIKYGHKDLRNVLERASARETAMRVAIGSIVRQLLEIFDIWIGAHVIQIHQIRSKKTFRQLCKIISKETPGLIQELCNTAEKSELRCSDKECEQPMKDQIDQVRQAGDSLGGIFEVVALNVPVGLGSFASWDKRLDSIIAADLMSIPAIKAVEIGFGTETGQHLGSEIHDPIIHSENDDNLTRSSNRAGGIEGGISNGQPIYAQATMKPIPTLTKPLPSVDLSSGKSVDAHKERSDVCAVPAASVVGEAMLAISIGKVLCEKLGGDSIEQMKNHFEADKI
jgi:chorismate synthase